MKFNFFRPKIEFHFPGISAKMSLFPQISFFDMYNLNKDKVPREWFDSNLENIKLDREWLVSNSPKIDVPLPKIIGSKHDFGNFTLHSQSEVICLNFHNTMKTYKFDRRDKGQFLKDSNGLIIPGICNKCLPISIAHCTTSLILEDGTKITQKDTLANILFFLLNYRVNTYEEFIEKDLATKMFDLSDHEILKVILAIYPDHHIFVFKEDSSGEAKRILYSPEGCKSHKFILLHLSNDHFTPYIRC